MMVFGKESLADTDYIDFFVIHMKTWMDTVVTFQPFLCGDRLYTSESDSNV